MGSSLVPSIVRPKSRMGGDHRLDSRKAPRGVGMHPPSDQAGTTARQTYIPAGRRADKQGETVSTSDSMQHRGWRDRPCFGAGAGADRRAGSRELFRAARGPAGGHAGGGFGRPNSSLAKNSM